ILFRFILAGSSSPPVVQRFQWTAEYEVDGNARSSSGVVELRSVASHSIDTGGSSISSSLRGEALATDVGRFGTAYLALFELSKKRSGYRTIVSEACGAPPYNSSAFSGTHLQKLHAYLLEIDKG